MIKTKKKICKICGEEKYLYARGMCKICTLQENMQKAKEKPIAQIRSTFSFKGHKSATKDKKPSLRKAMAPRTSKRQKQEVEYAQVKKRVQQQPNCFFCGEPVKNGDDHHLKGRDGDLLTDEKYQVHCHRQCHNDYHFQSIHKWKWRDTFFKNLKKVDKKLLAKELFKMYKI